MFLAGVNFPLRAGAIDPEGGATPFGGGIEGEKFQGGAKKMGGGDFNGQSSD
jgi:hypothetical protein